MPEQDRNALEWHTCQKTLNGEGVAQPMGDHEVLSLVHTSEVKECSNLGLPVFYRGLQSIVSLGIS
jgi:hypothetical protein